MKTGNHGFTLLEVMVALAIFAISALVILESTTQSIRQQTQLENKTFALWAAENQFTKLRLQNAWPETGTTDSRVTLVQKHWLLQQSVEETANPLLRKITVAVTPENNTLPLVTLHGFLGEH